MLLSILFLATAVTWLVAVLASTAGIALLPSLPAGEPEDHEYARHAAQRGPEPHGALADARTTRSVMSHRADFGIAAIRSTFSMAESVRAIIRSEADRRSLASDSPVPSCAARGRRSGQGCRRDEGIPTPAGRWRATTLRTRRSG